MKKQPFILTENFTSSSEQVRKSNVTKIMEIIINNMFQQEQKTANKKTLEYKKQIWYNYQCI